MKPLRLLIVSAAASAAAFANLIPNGNFEAGNSGFASNYLNNPPIEDPAEYAVDTNPLNVHPLFLSMGDHTTGSGNMFIGNGATKPAVVAWLSSPIAVAANSAYAFEGYGANVCCNAGFGGTNTPSTLEFSWEGDGSGIWNALAVETLPGTAGVWEKLSGVINTGSFTTVRIRLIDADITYDGNDFAVDDLSLTQVPGAPEVPEPSSILMGLAGLSALVILKRR